MRFDLSTDHADLRRLPKKKICANLRHLWTVFAITSVVNAAHAQSRPAAQTRTKKPTMAVLPFVPSSDAAKDKDFAAKVRHAVSQKLSTDANNVEVNGIYNRTDNVVVDNVVSALMLSFAPGKTPSDDEMQTLLNALDTDFVIAGSLKNRTLTPLARLFIESVRALAKPLARP